MGTDEDLKKAVAKMVEGLEITRLTRQRKCSHILGLAYWMDEVDTTIEKDNLSDIKDEYHDRDNDITWFKFCPHCGRELMPVDRDE